MNNDYNKKIPLDERVNVEAPKIRRERKRNRTKSVKYILAGLQVWKKPLKTIFYLVAWLSAAFFISAAAGKVAEASLLPLIQPQIKTIEAIIYNDTAKQILLDGFIIEIVVGVVAAVFVLILPLLFKSLGKPKGADKTDDRTAIALGLQDDSKTWFKRPFLIAIEQNKNIVDYTFWSEWFSFADWENENFLDAFCHSMSLDRKSVVVIRGGRKGKKITIRALPIDKARDGAATHDPMFKN
jgi:hypothetical protein